MSAFQGPNNRVVLQDNSGSTAIDRVDGRVVRTDDGGKSFVSIANPLLTWWDERQARAEYVLNYSRTQVDHPVIYDYATTPPKLLGATPPAQDTAYDGVVYSLANANNTVCDAGSTPLTVIGSPKTRSWYVARLMSVVGPIQGSQAIPLALDAGNASGTVGSNLIYVNLLQTTSATKFQLILGIGGVTSSYDLGTVCQIGSALCPAGPPVTIAVYFDALAADLVVEFQDVEVLRKHSSDGSLNNMPTAALGLYCYSNNPALGLRCHGGFAMVKRST